MKPLKKCVNGCDAPIKKPSKVLCEKCLAKLSAKFDKIGRDMARPEEK